MNIARTTFKRGRTAGNTRTPREGIRHLARALPLVCLSWAVTLILVHILLQRLVGYPLPTTTLLRAGFLWPTLALAAAVTLVNYLALSLLRHDVTSSSRQSLPGEPAESGRSSDPSPEATSHQLQHLHRNAERLDSVEQDLIRKISRSFPIDSATQQLLTEMRICTNRLRGELSDLERVEPEIGHDRSRQSPAGRPSNVEFDDVSVV